MKKELENYLWDRISSPADHGKWDKNIHLFPKDIIDEMVKLGMIQNHKQAWATLEKWTRKGIYDYGCRLDLGWKSTKRK